MAPQVATRLPIARLEIIEKTEIQGALNLSDNRMGGS